MMMMVMMMMMMSAGLMLDRSTQCSGSHDGLDN